MTDRFERNYDEQPTRVGLLLTLLVGITNISQMPAFVNMQVTRYISTPIWIAFFAFLVLRERRIRFRGILFFFILGALVGIYSYYMRFFTREFAESDLIKPILLSIFVLINGVNVGHLINSKDLNRVFTVYILTSLALCLSIYFSYLRGNSIEGRIYLYDSKNSVSQIIWTGMILILLTKFKKGISLLFKLGYAAAFVIMLYSLLMMKSRAVLICIPVVFILILLHGKGNKSARIVTILILAFSAILLSNEQTYNTFVKEVLYAGREATDIDNISSNRISEWETFGRIFFHRNFLFGEGKSKMESLILTSLLEYGIFVGAIILVLAASPIIWTLRHTSRTNSYRLILLSVAISYAINGIFEQLAPFGPGVKCYFLWLLLGILAAKQTDTIGEIVWQDGS